ncbi:MAG: N-acetylmuramoyl-L-alanine amidase [Candidatus Peribacteraceae bacterium]|nr:N-acetylmuramoyl-L-alanine amidase [Candidatus Peribacteraceae bacterium]
MIPLRATNYKLSNKWPQRVIIHHTACKVDTGSTHMDTSKFQTSDYHNINFQRTKQETGFHFIVEKVKNDFQAVVSQPLLSLCEFEDLDEKYWRDIHVALMGNYDEDLPPNRLYRVLAYRVLVPLTRLFLINEKEILFHSTISNDPDISCPGEFVNMSKIQSHYRTVLRRKTVTRK